MAVGQIAHQSNTDGVTVAGTGGNGSTRGPAEGGGCLTSWIFVAALLLPALILFISLPLDAFGPELPSRMYLLLQLGLSACGFWGVVYMVGVQKDYCLRKKHTGKDLCKKGSPAGEMDIPESAGLSPGIIYLIIIILCQLVYARTQQGLADYASSLLSVCFMLFLGFVDDVLDLPWRYKLVLPPIATLPLLCTYTGSTSVVVPRPFRTLLWTEGKDGVGAGLTQLGRMLDMVVTVDSQANGKIVELGAFFMLYMALLAVFCTNAINIYAGINGLEAGQSLIIAVAVLIFKLSEVLYENPSAGLATASPGQMFSITLIMPFIAVVLGLLRHNFYPARVFVGDTFCYFAGMTFAVIGIHGHFKMLVLLFIPQVINFLLSLPQLFKLVPCPRHRLPRFDAAQNRLLPSICPCKPHEFVAYKLLFRLPPDSDHFINLTLINVVLRMLGPTHERTLCLVLLALQVACCGLVLYMRFCLAHLFT